MKRWIRFTLIIITITFFFNGCGKKEEAPSQTAIDQSQGYTAQFGSFPSGYTEIRNIIPFGDSIYFTAKIIKEDMDEEEIYSVFQWDMLNHSEPVLMTDMERDGVSWATFFTDSVGCFYGYGRMSENDSHLICKLGADGIEEKWDVTGALQEGVDSGQISVGSRDCDGNFYLLSDKSDLFILDNSGSLIKTVKKTEYQHMIVSPGGYPIFIKPKFFLTTDGALEICHMDNLDTDLSRTIAIPAKSENDWLEAAGAGQEGLLCSDDRYLYHWNANSGELAIILGWNDPYVNITGGQVMGASQLSNNDILVILGDQYGKHYEYALLSKQYLSELPAASIITMGVNYPYNEIGTNMVQQFNRNSTNYKIEFIYYEDDENWSSMDKMDRDIISGNGPDLFDFSYMFLDDYAEKGVLEDLTPYFEKSEVINKEDVLRCIWDSGEKNGKMVSVIPSFIISAPQMLQSVAGQRTGISLSELQELQKQNPETALRSSFGFYEDLSYCLTATMDHFVDIENKKCYFTGEDFRAFIAWLSNIPRGVNEDIRQTGTKAVITYSPDDLENGKYLVTRDSSIISIQRYHEQLQSRASAKSYIGYPSIDGSLHTEINPSAVLGINQKSQNKEGAWAFIEYLLSARYQRENVSSLPVRKEFYEGQPKELMELLEASSYGNSYMTSKLYHTIYDIIIEETNSYLSGNATLEAATERLQNRAQLLLNELE